jgi:hemerythrin
MDALDRPEPLSLELPFMDQAHDRFFRLLTLVDEADNAELPAAWTELVACAIETFACEDNAMRTTGHAACKDHATQHHVALEVMREGALQAGEGRLLQVREMARQLRGWYRQHIRTMDAAFARHLRTVKLTPAISEVPAKAQAAVWPALCAAVEHVASLDSCSERPEPDRDGLLVCSDERER